MKWLLSITTLLLALDARAVRVEFSEEELAQESVYPVFDTPTAVKKKNVSTEGHFELGAFAGWTMNDAIVEPLNYGGRAAYHLTDISAIELFFTTFSTTVSNYGRQLETGTGFFLSHIDEVPKPSFAFLGSYMLTPWYGKISITKQMVWNIMIYATGGVGMITFDDSDLGNSIWNGGDSSLAFSAGLGLKIYFTNRLSLVSDLRYMFYQGPNPVHKGAGPVVTFEKHSVLNSVITIGLGYLL